MLSYLYPLSLDDTIHITWEKCTDNSHLKEVIRDFLWDNWYDGNILIEKVYDWLDIIKCCPVGQPRDHQRTMTCSYCGPVYVEVCEDCRGRINLLRDETKYNFIANTGECYDCKICNLSGDADHLYELMQAEKRTYGYSREDDVSNYYYELKDKYYQVLEEIKDTESYQRILKSYRTQEDLFDSQIPDWYRSPRQGK